MTTNVQFKFPHIVDGMKVTITRESIDGGVGEVIHEQTEGSEETVNFPVWGEVKLVVREGVKG